MHPLNAAFRFLLELAALFSLGTWGWTQHGGAARWFLAIGVPLVAAVLWGTFAVPMDPSRSGNAPVPVPGIARLLLELAIFGAASAALVVSGWRFIGLGFALATIIHYAVGYKRLVWLLRG